MPLVGTQADVIAGKGQAQGTAPTDLKTEVQNEMVFFKKIKPSPLALYKKFYNLQTHRPTTLKKDFNH